MTTKLLIAFSEEDIQTIDSIASGYGLPSRASAVRMAVRKMGTAATGYKEISDSAGHAEVAGPWPGGGEPDRTPSTTGPGHPIPAPEEEEDPLAELMEGSPAGKVDVGEWVKGRAGWTVEKVVAQARIEKGSGYEAVGGRGYVKEGWLENLESRRWA